MIFPSSRMLWLVALFVVPLCAAAGWLPLLFLPALLCTILLAGVFVLDAVRLTRLLAPLRFASVPSIKCFKDRASSLSLSVDGRSPALAALSLSLDWPPALKAAQPALQLGAENKQSVEIEYLPLERGLFHISRCYLSALSPWKLWHLTSKKPIETDVRVFPDLARESAARILLSKRTGGLRTVRFIGRGREFERLREYTRGDNFDEIYWKATARRSRPIVKVFQLERTQDVYAILDSSRLGARNNALEKFVTAALTLALAAENGGDNFGLVTFSDRVDRFLPAARGRGHFARCRNSIYDLQSRRVSPDFAELFTFLQLRIRRRALLLLLTDLSDPILAETFARDAPMLSRRHVVVVNRLEGGGHHPLFSGELPGTEDAVVDRLASHLQWVRLRDLETSLGRIGIRVFSLRSQTVSSDLVRHYEDIKRKQVL